MPKLVAVGDVLDGWVLFDLECLDLIHPNELCETTKLWGAKLNLLEKLPIYSSPRNHAVGGTALRVDGLVTNRLKITQADLERLPQRDLVDDFTCLEGWTVPCVKWGGVLLETVLSFAKPAEEARYVQASAEGFSIPVPIDRAGRVLLAIRLHDKPLPAEHGGPVRLVVPDGQCFMQIKWLDHLELRRKPGTNTAERIALRRLGVQKASF